MQESDNLAVVVAFLSGFLGATIALLVLGVLAFVLFVLPQNNVVDPGPSSAAVDVPSHKATIPTLESIGLSQAGYITGDFNARIEECLQFPELPAGCEVAAMTSVLRALGFDTDLVAFTDDYVLKVEGEPELVYSYSGSPYERGAAFPPAMARAGNAYLKDQDSPWRFIEPENATIDDMIKVVSTGRPVLLWTTMYGAAPEFASITIDGYEWYNNEHCVVFFGLADDGNMQIMDPLSGISTQDRKKFEEVYAACGQHALVLSQTQTDAVDAAEAVL